TVTQAVRRGLGGRLGEGRPLLGVLLEVVARLEVLDRRVRDRQVAGRHVPPHLLVWLGEELHAPGDARVVGRLLALRDREGRGPACFTPNSPVIRRLVSSPV